VNNNSKSPQPSSEPCEESPGFIVERRTVLAGLGALLTTGLPPASQAATLSFAEFLNTANAVAKGLADDQTSPGQDEYLRSIAALAARLEDVPLPERFNNTNQGDTPEAYRIGFNPGGDPFTVLHWRLEPGARCRPHAHTYGNVVSVGLEGQVRARNYEVVGEPDYEFGGTFRVRQTVDQLLGPGDVNLVSLDRNYIHGFVAGPDGARGLDITTRLKPRPGHGTPFLDIGSTPLDDFLRTYEASWIYYD
jgi:predicted metal-dependent enzyme (double-stranded beta helix superfamily)